MSGTTLPTADQPLVGRRFPCTPSERLLSLVHDGMEGEGMITAVAECDRYIPAEGLEAALGKLQRRHPKLRCAIVSDAPGTPHFQVHDECAAIPWTWEETDDADGLRNLVLHRRPGPFTTTAAPIARFFFLAQRGQDRTWIVCWIHHAIADALTMWQLYSELLEFIAHPERPAGEVAADGFDRIPPHRPTAADALWLFGRLGNRLIVDRLLRTALPPAEVPPPGGIAHLHLNVEQTSQLADNCRREDLSVFFALGAAAMRALADHYGWQGRLVGCQSPINLRDRVLRDNERDAMGLFVGGVRLRVRLPSRGDSIWSAARRYRDAWMREAGRNDPLLSIQRLGRAPFSPRMLGGRTGALAINNLGRLTQSSTEGTPQLIDFFCLGQARYSGAAINVHSAAVNGRLNLTLRSECLSQTTLDGLLDHMRRSLESALATKS
jgi:hypothetical protein